VIDEHGAVRTRIMTDYARHHGLVDWTGDGLAEVVVAQPRGLYDGRGQRVATFVMDEDDDRHGEERLVLIGDFSGDGVPDVLLTRRDMTRVYVYKNDHGTKPHPPAPLGTERNFTLY